MMTLDELVAEMIRLSQSLDKGLHALNAAGREWAVAEDAYRLARAIAFLNSEGTVDARKSETDLATSEERLRVHIADGIRVASLEAVRSRRAQLSALQTVANAWKEELAMARTGPEEGL